MKKRKLDERISGLTSQAYQTQAKPRTAYGLSTQQISKFYEHLHASGTKPAILSLACPYNKDYVTKKSAMDLPTTLDGLYSEQLSRKSFTELLSKVDEVFTEMSCSEEQAVNVEESTREQRNSKVWTKMRAGRITASNFHQICQAFTQSDQADLLWLQFSICCHRLRDSTRNIAQILATV